MSHLMLLAQPCNSSSRQAAHFTVGEAEEPFSESGSRVTRAQFSQHMSRVRFLRIGLSLQANSNSLEPLTFQEVGSIRCPHPKISGVKENFCPPDVGGGGVMP